MWVVANQKKTRYLAHDENGDRSLVDHWADSTAFDSRQEAKEEADALADSPDMQSAVADDVFTVQLR